MARCDAELCPFWTGDGCICGVFGLEVEDRPKTWHQMAAEEGFDCRYYDADGDADPVA